MNFLKFLCITFLLIIHYGESKPMTSDVITPRKNLIWWPNDQGEAYYPAFITSDNLKFLKNDLEDYEVQHEDINFYLYNKHSDEMEIIYLDNDRSLLDSHFDFNAESTRFITHGFNSNANGLVPYATEYMKREELINVILIDWGKLATTLWYNVAAGHTLTVGEKTARFIEFIVSHGVRLESIHMQGHSLGAHVAGWAGSLLRIGQLERINALDPALPLFEGKPDSERFDASDAKFTAVQHTGMGLLSFVEPRGHVDYYPNGGRKQPGCGLDPTSACSHIKAQDFMVESINSPFAFRACKCSSWEDYTSGCDRACPSPSFMGVETDSTTRGLFYMSTNPESPFGQG